MSRSKSLLYPFTQIWRTNSIKLNFLININLAIEWRRNMTLCSWCRDQLQDASGCVWVSTRSFDVSQASSIFDLHDMIRLGDHLSPSSTVWIKPLKFVYSDFSRSSLSVALLDWSFYKWNTDFSGWPVSGCHHMPNVTIPLASAAFSPPSVSVSLKEERLLVKVQFPCAASRRCSPEGCCPITELIDPWTTVTVWNTLSHSGCRVCKLPF